MKKAKAASEPSEPAESRPKILVVDDDEQIVKQVTWALSERYKVLSARDRASALEVFRREAMPVVLLDLGLPPHPREASEGLLALEDFLEVNPSTKVIIVSGNSERENALHAVEKGAQDIFPKPIDVAELKTVLRRVYQRVELEQESLRSRELTDQVSFEEMIGSSPQMKTVYVTVRKVAAAEVPVLIAGESGTGKELVARAIHNLSGRQQKLFVAINCGAIPESLLESELFGYEKGAFTGATASRPGRLEYAKGGTLFLDEIGDISAALQVKLLRFLQQKVIERVGGRKSISVDSRVIAATHQNLQKAVQENRFREDLYFRLAVVNLFLPPLRDRGDDVLELAEHLVCVYCKELKKPLKKFSRQAIEAMKRHPWPGNVRELQNRLKQAVVLAEGPVIGSAELELESVAARTSMSAGSSLKQAREALEKEWVIKALDEHERNISKAARALGISRPTLYELISRYGL